jgi:N-methylhydantoinase B
MKQTFKRTAFSPVLYEMIDFGCGLYDVSARLLAQAKAAPAFLGTLGFGIQAAVANLGGADALNPGDVLWSTSGYDNGSHSQDAVVIVPAFLGSELVGYATVKGHQVDIGAMAPYCCNSTDNFQEGVNFPGVRLYKAGELQRDMYRTILANSRLPFLLDGDVQAQIASARVGAEALVSLIRKHGQEPFAAAVEHMFAHGEKMVRQRIAAIPDGRYVAECSLDDDGIGDEEIRFQVAMEVRGDELTVDYSDGPPEQRGPVNCPWQSAVAGGRIAAFALFGGSDLPNEGHFRPIEVVVRPGTMFCPRPPAPIFLYAWANNCVIEALQAAVAPVMPEGVAAGTGGDLGGIMFWDQGGEGKGWLTAMDHPAGSAATAHSDGGGPMMILPISGVRTTPVEILEARYPLVVERYELAADSCGPGRFRGGPGVDVDYRVTADVHMMSVVERTKMAPWGVLGGEAGRPNSLRVVKPDGSVSTRAKVPAMELPKGTLVSLQGGGGGGFGPPAERDPGLVIADIEAGYLTELRARQEYPHAFA